MNDRPTRILEAGVAVIIGPLLMFSLYLLIAGHNQPGGGFAGGLVAGVSVVLAWSAGGVEAVHRAVPIRSTVLMGSGVVAAAVTGFVPQMMGLDFLTSGYLELSIPLVGKVKATSALFFDVGVYLLVLGMAVALVRALGEVAPDPEVGA